MKGWFGESYRHYLAGKGFRSRDAEVRAIQGWVQREVRRKARLDAALASSRVRRAKRVRQALEDPVVRKDVSGEEVVLEGFGGEVSVVPKQKKAYVQFMKRADVLLSSYKGAMVRAGPRKKKELQLRVDALERVKRIDPAFIVRGDVPPPDVVAEVAVPEPKARPGLLKVRVARGSRFLGETQQDVPDKDVVDAEAKRIEKAKEEDVEKEKGDVGGIPKGKEPLVNPYKRGVKE